MPPSDALRTLEQQKAELLSGVAEWSQDELAYRPAPAAWTAVEVLDHLVRVEREILSATQRGLAHPRRRRVRDRVGVAFIDWLFRTDRRVRVPRSVPEVLPAPDAELATVRRAWDDARRDLDRFLVPLTGDQLRVGVFQHPVAGWMSVPQVLRFFWVHSHHHGFQLARLRAAARER